MSFPFDRIGLDSVFEKDDGAAAAAAASAAALLSSGRCHPNGRHESADRTWTIATSLPLRCFASHAPNLAQLAEFYRVLPSFTGFNEAPSDLTGFHCGLPGLTKFLRVDQVSYPSLIGFYLQIKRNLPSFTEFFWVALGSIGVG